MFEKGNKSGRKFSATHQPAHRRKAKAERLKLFYDLVEVEPLTAAECAKIDATLLTLTQEQLESVRNNAGLPVMIRNRADYLLSNGFEATEKLQDRSFGRPKQKSELAAAFDMPKIECKVFGAD